MSSERMEIITSVDGNEAVVLEKVIRDCVMTDGKIDPGKSALVIVPSSMTLAYERILIDRVKAADVDGLFNVRVLSDKALPGYVFNEAGYGPGVEDVKRIDDGRKMVRVFSSLGDLSDDLRFFKNQNRLMAAQRICETLDQLSVHGYTDDVIRQLIDEPYIPIVLKNKLTDILSISETVASRQKDDEMEDGSIWNLMCRRLQYCNSIKNTSRVLICGFSHFGSRFASLARALADLNVPVCFCMQEYENENILGQLAHFEIPYKTIDVGVEAAHETNPAILALGESCIRVGRKHARIPYTDNDLAALDTYQAPTQYLECVYAVQQIVDWHKKYGYDWSEMGIVIPSGASELANMLSHVLETAGIPYFARTAKPLRLTGCTSFLQSSIDAIAHNFDKDSMIGVLKSGYSCLSKDEAMRFANYISQYNLSGAKWKDKIRASSAISPDEADALNAMRERMLEPLTKLKSQLTDRHAGSEAQATAIYNYLIENGVYTRLVAESQDYIDNSMVLEADFIRQSWDCLLDCIDTIASGAFSNRHIGLDTLCSFVSLSLKAAEVKFIPQSANAVLIETPDNCIPGQLKAVVAAGQQDSPYEQNRTLFSASECDWLDSHATTERYVQSGIFVTSLADTTPRQDSFELMIQNYRTVSAATEHLALTASITSHSGKRLAVSRIFADVVAALRARGLNDHIHGSTAVLQGNRG